MTKWIKRLEICCPNLKQLSLFGNPGISSTFNGGTALEHVDYRYTKKILNVDNIFRQLIFLFYRMFVISILSRLQYLDDTIVTDAQRIQSKTYKSAYSSNGGPLKFVEKFGSSTISNLFKYDKDQVAALSDYRSSPTTISTNTPTTDSSSNNL